MNARTTVAAGMATVKGASLPFALRPLPREAATCQPFSVEITRPGPLRQIRDSNANLRSRLQLLMLMGTLC